ncbi:Sucrase/ferredoxin-like-domain-containing protein [Xylariomycetidae sp. FL0641]|nr:Sucrase/ferredoxin-like-domain-containing protein [Xylariomycetidae sp. FL0641]
MTPWKYDAFLHTFSILVDLFFREVHPRGAWRVPRTGPILFVAAPHANQFVDGLVLQRTLKNEANRRVGLLIAEKSVHGFIGWGSRQTGSVPVGRAQDKAKPAKGLIYLPDPVNDPTLIRGIGTDFEKEAEVGGMIFLPSVKGQSGSSVDIAKILGPEEIRTKRAFKGKVPIQQLTGREDIDSEGKLVNKEVKGPRDGYEGTKFKLAPHIDQTEVYKAVFNRLKNGGCVGIFPEGGSHDRTELLPLKAGVAIMALGALAEDPDCGLQIVPVGMNYFHAHKFRSRAVVEFGSPFQIPPDVVEKYKNNQRRDAIGQTLDMVYQALSAVTVSAPDYDTLMCIQAARRLYNTGKKLPLPTVVELNRRLAIGFSKYKDDPRIIDLMKNVKDYNKQLRYLNIKDHQVSYAKMTPPIVIFTLLYRVTKLLILSIGVIPGTVLFAPVFIATKYISHKKAKEALAGSSVKIQGRDVMATWKLLVAMAFAPVLYNLYSISLAVKVYQDHLWGYVPEWVPFWLVYMVAWIIFPAITYASFRFGEVGMDILKSLRPLVLCISPTSSYNMPKLREQRAELSEQVVRVINDLGPDMYEDFDRARLISDPTREDGFLSSPEQAGVRRDSESTEPTPPDSPGLSRRSRTLPSRNIPRNESFSNIGDHGMFATRPPSRSDRSHSRSHSRSSSGGGVAGGFGFPVSGFTTLDSAEGFKEANNKIRDAMRQRGTLRRRKSGAAVVIVAGMMCGATGGGGGGGGEDRTAADMAELFPPTDPAVDGDACTRDCDSCHVSYPRGFKIDEEDLLYGHIKGFSTHVIVATGKSDWVRDVEDEKGSVMQAFGRAAKPENGRLMLSASNLPTPSHTTDYSEPTTLVLLPAFVVLENVTPDAVPAIISTYVNAAPTSADPLGPVSLPPSLPVPSPASPDEAARTILARPCPHRALVLLCSQKTRDARCGQSAPLLRRELERHLRPLGLHRDPDDERPGGVGVCFISHVGGHKYSANVLVYRRPDAFGLDGVKRADMAEEEEEVRPVQKGDGEEEEENVGAAQCIWLARVRPQDCENLVRYTVLQGKVVKPEHQLRGGFDRAKGLMSW